MKLLADGEILILGTNFQAAADDWHLEARGEVHRGKAGGGADDNLVTLNFWKNLGLHEIGQKLLDDAVV